MESNQGNNIAAEAVDLRGGCVIVPKCKTVAVSSDRYDIVQFIKKPQIEKRNAPFLLAKEGSAEVGGCDAVKAEAHGTAIAGDKGTAEAGDDGHAEAGEGGTAIAGDRGVAYAKAFGIAIAGKGGSATVGVFGIAVAGAEGSAGAGEDGYAIVGENGVALVRPKGIAAAGLNGKIVFVPQGVQLIVGENGIKPDTFYRLDSSGNPEEVNLLEEDVFPC